MTKRHLINFFNKSKLTYDNRAWWRGEVGYLIFDRCLLTIVGHNEKPTLLLIQKIKDIPFIVESDEKGVIVGVKECT